MRLLQRIELASAAADVASDTRRIAEYQGLIRYRACHDGAGADQRKSADGEVTDNRRVCANRSALANDDLSDRPVIRILERAIGVDRTRPHIVGKAHMRTDEHAVFDGDAVEHRYVVLDFHPIANGDTCINVDISADVAVFANHHVFADLRMAPNSRPFTDVGLWTDLYRGMNETVQCNVAFCQVLVARVPSLIAPRMLV